MGLFYKVLINKMRSDFKNSGSDDLESFLRKKQHLYQDEFKLDDLLMLLNIRKLLEEEGVKSEYFERKFEEASQEDARD